MSAVVESPNAACVLRPEPATESRRLAAVHSFGLLDTPPEAEFDVTTRLASRLFNLPVALVALMDSDRLWFKSKLGVDLPQLDRDVAFCAHAIMRPDEVLVVEDLAADERFATNPLVTGGPQLRFYAGAPLLTDDGLALGTLAVLGGEPRNFTSGDREALKDLAASVMTAIQCRKRADSLAELASTDYVTGLNNRIAFEKALVQWHGMRGQGALLQMDLDGFKAVNDRHGHAAGDRVLVEIGRRLKAVIRDSATLARVGGDEFALIDPSVADTAAAAALAQRLLDAVCIPMTIEGVEQPLTVDLSIGIAMARSDAAPAELVNEADHALYQAKRRQMRAYQFYGESLSTPTVMIASETGDHAASEDRCGACAEGIKQPFPFTMAFQPIVRISTGEVFAYEALVRGMQGESAASILGRVTASNRYAFDQSCRRTAIELSCRLGLMNSDARLSINFMPGAMYEPENCVKATLAAARRVNLPLDRLIFEVTEGEEVSRPDHLAQIFRVYRSHGFLPAVDDFGAGYSGLNMLAEFQPAIIKLDRQLIQNIDQSRPRQAIVRGVLGVCADLDIVAIAEGVETVAEYAHLKQMGVDLFQGYLFARPAFEALPTPIIPTL